MRWGKGSNSPGSFSLYNYTCGYDITVYPALVDSLKASCAALHSCHLFILTVHVTCNMKLILIYVRTRSSHHKGGSLPYTLKYTHTCVHMY